MQRCCILLLATNQGFLQHRLPCGASSCSRSVTSNPGQLYQHTPGSRYRIRVS
jgi:hypothetical protein